MSTLFIHLPATRTRRTVYLTVKGITNYHANRANIIMNVFVKYITDPDPVIFLDQHAFIVREEFELNADGNSFSVQIEFFVVRDCQKRIIEALCLGYSHVELNIVPDEDPMKIAETVGSLFPGNKAGTTSHRISFETFRLSVSLHEYLYGRVLPSDWKSEGETAECEIDEALIQRGVASSSIC